MDDTKKLIEKYKRELMELSRTAPKPASEAAEPAKTPKIIGYVTEESSEFPAVFDRFITEAVENNDIETICAETPEAVETAGKTNIKASDVIEINESPQGSNNAENGMDVENEPDSVVEFAEELAEGDRPSDRSMERGAAEGDRPSNRSMERGTAEGDRPSDRPMVRGTGETISNFPVASYENMAEFEARNTGGGMLEFRVFTASEALPVEDAKITVSVRIDGSDHVLYTAMTDQSGETAMTVLPAPSKELSQNADNRVQPFSLYDATVEKEGFTKVLLRDIPIFDGVRSIQRVAMIPEENANAAEEITEVPNAD